MTTNALWTPMLLLGGLVALLGSVLVGFLGWRYRRRTSLSSPTLTEPPKDLSPALSGMLLAVNPNPGWKQVLATLFDLAQKGVLSFAEVPPPKSTQYKMFALRKQPYAGALSASEQGLLNVLFGIERTELPLSELSKVYKRQANAFTTPLRAELQAHGFLDPERQQIRQRFGRGSMVLFLLSLVGIIASLLVGSTSVIWPIVFPALGLLAVSTLSFFIMLYYSPLSDRGAEAAQASRSFSDHLLAISTKAHMNVEPGLFDRYLPYATSYGLLRQWIRCFQRQEPASIPAWFTHSETERAESFNAFTTVMVAAHTTGSTGGGTSGYTGTTMNEKVEGGTASEGAS